MKDFVNKLIKRLQSEVNYNDGAENGAKQAIAIVNELAEEYFKALKEKDEPKKPFMFGIGEYRATCPNCNKWLETHSSKVFCPYCGQKLDWSK